MVFLSKIDTHTIKSQMTNILQFNYINLNYVSYCFAFAGNKN